MLLIASIQFDAATIHFDKTLCNLFRILKLVESISPLFFYALASLFFLLKL